MKTCPFCAQQIPDDATRCPACQADLVSGAPAAPQPPSAAPPPSAPVPLSAAGWPVPPAARTPAPEAKTSGMAIASVVLGSIGAFIPVLPSIAAIILGHKSRTEIRNSFGKVKGDGLALAGLILGYSLLSIVLLVFIIAALAIPNLLRARMAANEAAAVGSVRTLNVACLTYASDYGGFPPSIDALGGEDSGSAPSESSAQLIDSPLARGVKYGYLFSYAPGDKDSSGNIVTYTISANPITPGVTGVRYFFSDQTDVIRANSGAPADANSPSIE
jgi:type IV pilus assembly protein PilA